MFKASKNIIKLGVLIIALFYIFPQGMNMVTKQLGLEKEKEMLFSNLPIDVSDIDDPDRRSPVEKRFRSLIARSDRMSENKSAWTNELEGRRRYSRSKCSEASNGMPVASVDNLKVHVSPEKNSDILGVYPGLSQIAVTEAESGHWYEIVISGGEKGYVRSSSVYMPITYIKKLSQESL